MASASPKIESGVFIHRAHSKRTDTLVKLSLSDKDRLRGLLLGMVVEKEAA